MIHNSPRRVQSKASILIPALILTIFIAVSVSAGKEQEKSPDKETGAQNKVIYEGGVALLEVFKADSIDQIPHLQPVITVPWMHDFACMAPAAGTNIWLVRDGYKDAFLVPELAYGLGARPGEEYSYPYVAQITFYYEAKESAKYTFSVWHGRNACVLTVGDFLITDLSPDEPTAKGACQLEKGFHRVVFWLISNINSGTAGNDPYFQVKVFPPGASEPIPVTRDMMFMEGRGQRRN